LAQLHRDRGSAPPRGKADKTGRFPTVPEDDAPAAPLAEPGSGQVLMDALRSVEKGSEAERALLSVVDLLVKKAAGSDGGSPPIIPPQFLRRASLVIVAAFGLIAPAAETGFDRLLSPTSALERKLDEVLVQQQALQNIQAEDHSTFIALAKWVVECQMATANGRTMPEPPAPVRLILVQDELTRTTGQ
jgi:hypothetical protein